jgi:hypothetical protein
MERGAVFKFIVSGYQIFFYIKKDLIIQINFIGYPELKKLIHGSYILWMTKTCLKLDFIISLYDSI